MDFVSSYHKSACMLLIPLNFAPLNLLAVDLSLIACGYTTHDLSTLFFSFDYAILTFDLVFTHCTCGYANMIFDLVSQRNFNSILYWNVIALVQASLFF